MMNKLTRVTEVSQTMQKLQEEMTKVRAERPGWSGDCAGGDAADQCLGMIAAASQSPLTCVRAVFAQAGIIEEMVDSAMEGLDADEDEEAADEEVDRVMAELNAEAFQSSASAPSKPVAQAEAQAEEQDEEEDEEAMSAMRDRLAQLKSS